ncbi:UNVERIFIED_CONTAM: putative B3 domain-containing protein [Sesamum radiatum]|uniref:B3 domain-containing protein n=1 Tax=Sesamum radiatum TaxID=300843 RepID=A0AAW2RXI2_SESRA
MSLKDGWPEFVHAHELGVGDFVVFEHIGDLHFNALVFDLNGCGKEFVVCFSTKRLLRHYVLVAVQQTPRAIPTSFRRNVNIKDSPPEQLLTFPSDTLSNTSETCLSSLFAFPGEISKMAEKLGASRHFFKVMLPGFQQKLKLPPGFCKKLKEEKSLTEAIVRSGRGTWKMKVCRNVEGGSGMMSLEDGWGAFVCAHGLSVGDFVVFEHTGHLHFNALVFDPSACEKEFLVDQFKKEQDHQDPPHQRNTKGKSGKKKAVHVSYHSKNPHFILTMTPYHAHKQGRVTIPIKFMRSNNLGKMSSVSLRNPDQKKAWSVRVLVEESPRVRARMDRGWHDFYVANKLKEGDVCVFELNPRLSRRPTSIAMDVKILTTLV